MSLPMTGEERDLLRSIGGLTSLNGFTKGVGGTALVLLALYIYLYPYTAWRCSFRNLDGPAPSSLAWGSLREVIDEPPAVANFRWIKNHGLTFRIRSILGRQRLVTADPVAIGYILQHSDDFVKPMRANQALSELLGNGVLTAEGASHRRQRRVLNPAFSPAIIRDMGPILWEKAHELRLKLTSLIEDDAATAHEVPSPTPPQAIDIVKGGRKIDILRYMSKFTLDVIGTAGFAYEFNSFGDKTNPLADAFKRLVDAGQKLTLLRILQAVWPALRIIPTKNGKVTAESRGMCTDIGRAIVEKQRRAIEAEYSGGFEKNTDMGKDLLSLLMKANMAPDLRPDQRLTDDEVLAQITTFMLAGSETTSVSATWAIWRMVLNPAVQARLREEVRAVGDDRPSLDELNALPYLDKVVHESLRLDGVVPGTERTCVAKEAFIPLGTPVVGRNGEMVDRVHMKKGSDLMLPIICVNRMKEFWGEDADQFNPDRFDVGGIPRVSVPGVYGNLLTFLGGARNCIGYRLALAELKVALFTLIRSFTFEELPSRPTIETNAIVVMRPRVAGEVDAGLQLPLMVRLVAD